MKNQYCKRVISVVLSAAILTGVGAPAFAAQPTAQKEGVTTEQLTELLANAYMLSDEIDVFEKTYEFDLGMDKDHALDITFSDEWIADARAFMNDYITEYGSAQARAKPTPSEEQYAKAYAIAYAIDRAKWSVAQDSSLDIGKEAQYMFISHYIDRNDYWWGDQDTVLLLDGSKMSGESGQLAQWLVPEDRQQYDAYMGFTGLAKAFQTLADFTKMVISGVGFVHNSAGSIQALQEKKLILSAANAAGVPDNSVTLSEYNKIIDSGYHLFIKNIQDNPEVALSSLYETYMQDEQWMPEQTDEVKKQATFTMLAVAGAFVTGGFSAEVSAIVTNTIFLVNQSYLSFYNYTAWLAMRYGYSGRYSARLWRYLDL